MALPNNPQTRKEMYLSNMAGQGTALPSEPHTREEEYLDYIAKNRGGGGTGEGDMTKAVYDDDLAVASAGGIADYVAGAITGKVDKVQGKGLSTNDYDDSAKAIVDGVTTALEGKVSKSNTAGLVKNDGTIDTTTTGAVAANTSAISAIKDGTNIDSFGDVETALAGKMPNYGIGIGLYVDSYTNQLRADAVTKAIKDSPKLITSGAVFSGLSPKYGTADQDETDLDGQDKFPFYDNSASAKRHTTFGNIKAKLKEYFDSLYVAAVAGKGLSTNDYDNTAKGIVDNIQSNVIANTKLIKDTVGWTNKNIGKYVNQSLVGDSTAGFNLVSGGSSLIAKLEHNKDYIVKRKSGQGDRFRVVLFINAPSVMSPDTSASQAVFDNTKNEYTISSGNYNYAVFTYVSSSSTAISQDTAEAMIRDADILDSTYEPYFGSTAFPRSEQAVLGAVNVLVNKAVTQTKNNTTYTVNANKSISLSGTANDTNNITINTMTGAELKALGSKLYLSGGCNGSAYLQIRTDTWQNVAASTGNEVEFSTASLVDATIYTISAVVLNNTDTIGLVLYPQISTAPNQPYSYAMTNKELTEKKIGVVREITSSDNLDNIIDYGIYSIKSSPTNAPDSESYVSLLVTPCATIGSGAVVQTIFAHGHAIYSRTRTGNPLTWEPWYKFTGTVVS